MTDIRKVVEIRNRLEKSGLPTKVLEELDRWIEEKNLKGVRSVKT